MIVSLRGALIAKTPATAVVECGGVGYEALIPLSTYDRLPATGQECTLLTVHVVREDAQQLFGFATEDERSLFSMVVSVSGVGPKTALSMLSGMSPGDLQLAVADGDAKRLSAIKGVGKKTAERIIVELRGRINPVAALAAAGAAAGSERAEILRDAMMALKELGFAEDAARKMVQAALEKDKDAKDAQTVLRRALADSAK